VLVSGIGLGHQVRQYQMKTNYVSYATGDAMVPAFREAGIQLGDVDFCELYEPFSIGVIVQLEDLGFCEKGEGGPFVAAGNARLDGSIPVNTSGGQASWCYLQGYTPLAEAILQLSDRGGATQLSKANVALVTGHGGTNANPMMYSDGCMILRRDS
jgi:acetyl-CoA acetyltransferase